MTAPEKKKRKKKKKIRKKTRKSAKADVDHVIGDRSFREDVMESSAEGNQEEKDEAPKRALATPVARAC